VTRTVSCRFGQIEDADEVSEVEVRASWTPLPDTDGAMDLGVHLLAWCDLLCATAGLATARRARAARLAGERHRHGGGRDGHQRHRPGGRDVAGVAAGSVAGSVPAPLARAGPSGPPPRGLRGSRSCTTVSAPSALATSSEPPDSRARSRSRLSPTCRPRSGRTACGSKPGPSSRTVASTVSEQTSSVT
jgi:hypothetical protein